MLDDKPTEPCEIKGWLPRADTECPLTEEGAQRLQRESRLASEALGGEGQRACHSDVSTCVAAGTGTYFLGARSLLSTECQRERVRIGVSTPLNY